MPTHFIVHDKADTVGVMVVENSQAGQELTGWIMETDRNYHAESARCRSAGPQDRSEPNQPR